MLIAKLTISYDRGVKQNDEQIVKDALGLIRNTEPAQVVTGDEKPNENALLVRGLGTHFRSREDMDRVKECDKEARQIYNAFRERFLSTTIDGLYVVPEPGVAKAFIEGMEIKNAIQVRVIEFELSTNGTLDPVEVSEWAERVKKQLAGVSLGRSKEADEDGLRSLDYLASCPALSADTGRKIKELVAKVRASKMNKLELKRSIEKLDVKIEQRQLAPTRRTPVLV